MKAIIREEIEYKGVSVLIPRRECIQTLTKRKKQAGNESRHHIIRCGRTGHPLHRCRYGEAALKEGLYMKQAEVHGMIQRGGDVQSTSACPTSRLRLT